MGEDTPGLYLVSNAPKSYQDAMSSPNANEWTAAIMEEYNALLRKGMFEEVEHPQDARVHDGCLVFAEKVGVDGEITKTKARSVAKGYMEVWGEDFWNTYSPMLGCDTRLSCLTYTAAYDLKIHHLDAVMVYLNSDLHEEIFLKPPEGCHHTLAQFGD